MNAPDTALAAVDAAWLHMDRATNRMAITSVLFFDDVLAQDELVRLFEERLRHVRFHQRVVERGVRRRPVFVDANVDFAAHVTRAPWPAPGDETALMSLLSTLATEGFDRDRPLWHAHLVVDEAAHKCAVVFRSHHCLADGLALVQVLLELVDERHASTESAPVDVGRARPAPLHSLARLAVRGAWHGATMVKLASLRPDPRAPWKPALTTSKETAWTKPIALEPLKRAAHAVDAHLTDALLACVAGAVAHAARVQGELAPRRMRALVPTFLHDAERAGHDGAGAAGNRFGLIYVALPVDVADASERVRIVHRRTRRTLASADAAVALEILGAFGSVSRTIEDAGVAFFTSKATAMITSVPGPRAPVHLLGRTVKDIVAFGPAAGSIGLTAGLFSYAGHVRVAFAVDPALGLDASALVDGFAADAAALADQRD